MKKILGAAAAVAILAASAPAFAAVSDSAPATVNIITPLSVTASGSLNFGNILSGAGGTVVVSNAGVRSAGTIAGTELLGGVASTAPNFHVVGDTLGGAQYHMSYVTAPLHNAGGTDMPLSSLTPSNVSGTLSGTVDITVGATLTVGATQTPGTYTGSITATATYN